MEFHVANGLCSEDTKVSEENWLHALFQDLCQTAHLRPAYCLWQLWNLAGVRAEAEKLFSMTSISSPFDTLFGFSWFLNSTRKWTSLSVIAEEIASTLSPPKVEKATDNTGVLMAYCIEDAAVGASEQDWISLFAACRAHTNPTFKCAAVRLVLCALDLVVNKNRLEIPEPVALQGVLHFHKDEPFLACFFALLLTRSDRVQSALISLQQQQEPHPAVALLVKFGRPAVMPDCSVHRSTISDEAAVLSKRRRDARHRDPLFAHGKDYLSESEVPNCPSATGYISQQELDSMPAGVRKFAKSFAQALVSDDEESAQSAAENADRETITWLLGDKKIK
jgi:hypothetical protein